MRCVPLRRVVRALRLRAGDGAQHAPADDAARATDVGVAVARAAAHLPWESSCLVQAYAATAMLRRRGLDVTLVLAVRKDQADAGGYGAHAWSRCGDVVLSGGAAASQFTLVGSYSAGRRAATAR